MPLSSILIRNWPQFGKIFLMTVLILIFSFGWVWFREIPSFQNDLIRERTHATQYPIQMAISVLEVYRGRVAKGELPLREAQSQALRTLQETRYAGNRYFWVHDLSLTMLMHPFSPDLVGTSLVNYRDSLGNCVFREINERVRVKPEGVIEYTWPRPGSDIPERKMSCFKLYKPWGWVIGSGIYLDDVHADFSSIKKRVITSVLTAFLFALLFSLYVIYRINQPLRHTIAFAKQIADGQAVDSIAINPRTEGGKVVSVIKGLMSELQAAYRDQRSIIETTSDGFFIIGTDGSFREANQSFLHMVGYSREELFSLNMGAVDTQIPDGAVGDHVAEVMAKGAGCFENRYRRKDGTVINVEVSTNYTEDDNGRLICFVRDISERIRLRQEELKTSILKNAILENSPLGIAYVKDQRFQWVNSQLAEMFSASEGDMPGSSFPSFFHDEMTFEQFTRESTDCVIMGGVYTAELQLTRRDGSSFWCRVSGSRLEADADESGVIWLFEDISVSRQLDAERKLLEAQLIQAQKMEAIGKLAGGVAHEFNNILQVIGGYTMLLNEECKSIEHKKYLETIDAAVKRASRLTQGMLTYSRQQVFSLELCDIDDTIQQIMPFIDRAMGENITLKTTRAPAPVMCRIDSQHIQQAVINLITNARDAIRHRGEIRISTGLAEISPEAAYKHPGGRPGKFAVISVADTGAGMDDSTRARIFDPFYTTKEIGKGTGLGLSIVFGIMAQHNGFVTCDTSPGEGSVFSLYLPVDDSFTSGATVSSATELKHDKSGGTILLAEDDEETGKILGRLLESSGYTVLRAADGNEAVAVFTASGASIDLLLFDVMMPGKNGREALDEIRYLDPSVPACFISGYASDALDLDLSVSSINAFITKPVDRHRLVSTIEKLLRPADGGLPVHRTDS